MEALDEDKGLLKEALGERARQAAISPCHHLQGQQRPGVGENHE
jgi:hypothetical protein